MRRPTIVLLLAVGVALAGCGGVAGSADVAADKALNGPPVAELMAEGPLGERALGNPNAPITVIEYASLTCPHCASFQRDVFPRVKKEFIDTGKIRFIVREFPIGRTSGAAAIATRCVPPGQILPALQRLPAPPDGMGEPGSPPRRHLFGGQIEWLDRAEFDKCATNQTIIDGLTEVKQRGRKFGVVGTPTFFANGRKAQGTITFEEFKALLDPQSAT